MQKVLKRIGKGLAVIFSAVIVLLSVKYLAERWFGSDETKALYGMRDILHSYVKPCSSDLLDAYRQFYGSGSIENDDKTSKCIMYVYTDRPFEEIAAKVPDMYDDFKKYISEQKALSQLEEIEIWIDNKNDWSIKFSPKDDYIVLSPNYNSPDNAVEQALSYCEDFKEISVLEYHNQGIRIPDSFNVDFLTGFEKLEKFEMRGLKKQEYMDIVKSRMPTLDGVEVVISKT